MNHFSEVPPAQTPIVRKIVVADDSPIVRFGFRNLIAGEEDLECIAEPESAAALRTAIDTHQPDLLVLDLDLEGGDGLELIKTLLALLPSLRILACSNHPDTIYGARALRAGARGYVRKQQPVAELRLALRTILNGKIYANQALAALVFNEFINRKAPPTSDWPARLTDRELCILGLIGASIGTKQIAERLHLSVKTIETYREHLKRKLELLNGASLTDFARKWAQRPAQLHIEDGSLLFGNRDPDCHLTDIR